jgi:hypothetical protein
VAALFAEDAFLVTPDGMFRGRKAIEKGYEDTFQRSPLTIFSDPREYQLKAIHHAVWSARKWSSTLQGQTGATFVSGYWSAIYVREGENWKVRMLTTNVTLAASPTASPTDR